MSFPAELLSSVVRIVGRDGISKADFQASAGLSREFGRGVNDHNRALNFLLDRGAVEERDGRLFLGELDLESWGADQIIGEAQGLDLLANLPGFRGRKKFQEGLNREIGLLGEQFVMSLLDARVDPDLKYRIEHTSLVDDMAGYDIRTPSVSGVWEEVFLEVKTSARLGSEPIFHLTRNEAKVGERSDRWFLVFVSLTTEGPKLNGHLPFSEIKNVLPINQAGGLQWSEVSGRVPLEDLCADLP